jgi:hypothetical protein
VRGAEPMTRRTRLSACAAVLAGCARVAATGTLADGGGAQPVVEDVEPPPGAVERDARFTVRFSDPIDEGQLLAASGRSESVVLAAEANVERAAAAIEHAPLSAHERTLLVSAAADLAADRRSITIAPDRPLDVGGYFLLVSPRIKDDLGRRLAGNGARFAFRVDPTAPSATLVTPAAGGEAPRNLLAVRAFALAGRVSLLGPHGEELASAEAHGATVLTVPAMLSAGAEYSLALDGKAAAGQTFTAAPCLRIAAPSLQGGAPQLTVSDAAVVVTAILDWPAHLMALVADGQGAVVTTEVDVGCAPPACGPQSFACPASVRMEGLHAGTDYTLVLQARDDYGFTYRTAPQPFSTLASLPRSIVSEVMVWGVEGEYVELLNRGPGAADLARLALQGPDGVVRPLLGGPPPLPVVLRPGARAIAAGASFDESLYPRLPAGTPVLRASTQRLLGRGLSDDAPAGFRLVVLPQLAAVLDEFPSGTPRCAAGISLQRDEAASSDGASWACGMPGGTPGRPP